jgi:hypothetical protein
MRSRLLYLPMIVVFAAAACSTAPDRATTIGAQPAAATPAQEPVSQAPKPKGAGDQLTSAQAKAAMLTVADFPTGWASDKSLEPSDGTAKIEPVACQKMDDEMITVGKGAKVKEKATFSKNLSVLEMQVSSSDADDRSDQVKNLGDMLAKCAHYTSTGKSGKIESTLSPLSFPNLGDQTLAVRVNQKSDLMDVVGDYVFVATGHNTVSFIAAGLEPIPGAELEKIARTGMTKLAVAAKS